MLALELVFVLQESFEILHNENFTLKRRLWALEQQVEARKKEEVKEDAIELYRQVLADRVGILYNNVWKEVKPNICCTRTAFYDLLDDGDIQATTVLDTALSVLNIEKIEYCSLVNFKDPRNRLYHAGKGTAESFTFLKSKEMSYSNFPLIKKYVLKYEHLCS